MKAHKTSETSINPGMPPTRTQPARGLLLALFSAAALLLPNLSRAQAPAPTSTYTNDFDTASSVASWIYWYGLGFNNTPVAWDGTMDAGNNPSSGSMMVSLPFGASGDQAVWFGTFDNKYGYDGSVAYDGSKFTNITFKIHVQPGTAVDSTGDFGTLQVGLVDAKWSHGGTFYGNGITIPAAATNGWLTLTQAVDLTDPLLSVPGSAGVDFKYTSYSGYPTSPMTFWLDDLQVNLAPAKIAPPSVSTLSKPVAGLNLFSSTANGGNYQRTDIGLTNSGTGNSWLGAAKPVTYSITITNFPDPAVANYGAYQAQIFLTSGNFPLPTYETAPDYTETNLVFFEVQVDPDGTAYAQFRYKINEPNGNGNLFGSDNGTAGTLATLSGVPTVLGTWSMTFSDNTNVTLSGPGGVSTNFVFTNAIAATGGASNFGDPLNVFFGAQANTTSLIGREVVLSGVSITGNGNPITDDFLADTNLNSEWGIYAGDTSTVQLLRPDPGAWWVKWSLPDAGFGLQTTSNLLNPSSWTALTGPDSTVNITNPLLSVVSSGGRSVYVPSAYLNPKSAFFRLKQAAFTKLQILLPGETAAPGTPTGKTGTPTPQPVNGLFAVTVNAVDDNWTVIPSITDTIHITSTDTAPNGAVLPPDAALVSGSGTFYVTLQDTGNFTITASDVTDPTKTSATSSSVTAQ